MSQGKFRMGSAIDDREAISRYNERILVFTKKIEKLQERKEFSKQSFSLELYRRKFYRNLEETEVVEHQVAVTEKKTFGKQCGPKEKTKVTVLTLKIT